MLSLSSIEPTVGGRRQASFSLIVWRFMLWLYLLQPVHCSLGGLAGLPGSTDFSFQAKYLAEHYWSGLWMLGLLNGFWILFSTQLGNTDVLVRTITDTLWTASHRVRSWRDGQIARVYYGLLFLFTAWGLVAVHLGTAMQLFQYLGTLAGVVMSIAAVQLYLVNTRLLPKELQPSWWRKLALLLCSACYATTSGIAIVAMVKNSIWPFVKKLLELES